MILLSVETDEYIQIHIGVPLNHIQKPDLLAYDWLMLCRHQAVGSTITCKVNSRLTTVK